MKFPLIISCLFLSLFSFAQQHQLKELDINLKNYKYPFPVHYVTIVTQQQELQMGYMDVKPDNYNGKNVMLLHGKNFNGAYWKTTIEALTKKGYRVIVPDQIGFGKSDKPMNFQYSFQQLATNTKQILDGLGIQKVAVLGHSMGGMLATRFALMYPETVEKLILENPIGLEDWKLKVPYKEVDWWCKNELAQSYEKIKKYQLESYYDGKWKPEYDEWVNLLAGWTLNPDFKKYAWNAALTYDMIFTQPVVYEFQNIKCPTLLLIGTRDRTALGKPLVSEEVRKTMGLYENLGKETQKKIPNAKLVEIPNIGHMPHIERFESFIQPLVSFLN
ncbi:alpha/beta fold hydrolase [Flavobacterium sp. UMI-01]|uniref:alpha/beta fold hydrolase n=1 Tax=Flavobacterium sp. UMI-01 TaxID=1441053 RepID=UPI001C7CC5F2|nr:alpha/beta hydrolase [Flavobacterium sp. UMI-01]GIZ10099.1 alpha/beta hydrolase [Flavobacterium sp. UMI-01]